MKFERCERYERVQWTRRKQALHQSKESRVRAKLAKAYPLFADQIDVPPSPSLDEEKQQRQTRANSLETTMRSLYARVWREARHDYFSATPEQQQSIRKAWAAWRGPLTCMYFRYVVDVGTGIMALREHNLRVEQRMLRERALAHLAQQPALI